MNRQKTNQISIIQLFFPRTRIWWGLFYKPSFFFLRLKDELFCRTLPELECCMTSVVSHCCRLCKISLTWSVSFWSFFFVFFFLASYQFQGQLSETVTTPKKKKIKKQNLGERKWKTCPSVFSYLSCGFFIIKVLGCKQMSAEPSPVQTCDRTGRRFVPSAAATHLEALCWGRCLRQRRKSVMPDQTCY